jgi:hypothetical protein
MTNKSEDKPKKDQRVDATVAVVGPPPATGAS